MESRWRSITPTLRYCMEVEVHVYAFSVAANVLLSFFPFLIVLVSLCRYVFHWSAAEQAIYVGLRDYFAGQTGEFIVRNLQALVSSRGPFQWFSVFLLLFTANGVFEPLEVALNRAWGIHKTRSYVHNQIVSLGLIFACGSLAVLSTTLTAINRDWVRQLAGDGTITGVVTVLAFKIAAIPTTVGVLFLIYWLLPFGQVPWRLALRTALWVTLAIEGLKYLNLLIWPYLFRKFSEEYGPFVNSVTIIIWSFAAAMIVMAGAEWTARTRAESAVHT